MKRQTTRRAVVTFLGGVVASSVTGSAVERTLKDGNSKGKPKPDSETHANLNDSRIASSETYTILDDTEHATDVHVIQAETDGPTVMVTGGIHGNEVSGYRAASDIANWDIDAGTLVVVPKANAVAVERRTRTCDHGDLNRQFPTGEQPTTSIAQAIWDVVNRHDPDMMLDLHRSTGIFGVDEGKVGQAIFHSGGPKSGTEALQAAEYMNTNVVPDSMLAYKFDAVPLDFQIDPSGLLVGKAAQDLGISTFLVEVTSKGLSFDKRVGWTKAIVEHVLTGKLLLEESAENEPPVAKIETDPANADDSPLEPGTTVTLDGSNSTDANDDIVSYEWDLDGDDAFEETGATTELTLDNCVGRTVALRVTDEAGQTDTRSITLTVGE